MDFNQLPTPTAFPTVAPEDIAMGMNIPDVSLWDSAPHAIQWWNVQSIPMQFMQTVILILLLYGALMYLRRYLDNYMDSF